MSAKQLLFSFAFWGALLGSVAVLGPWSALHDIRMGDDSDALGGWRGKLARWAAPVCCAVLCAGAVAVMTLNPVWTERAGYGHLRQYEQLARSFVEGRLDLGYEADPVLAELENPYDPAARAEAGANVHWDSAYYDGKYYVYFGVAPVVLFMVPSLLITGAPLEAWQVTQICCALFYIALFALARLLAKRFFPRMSLGCYLALASAFSIMSSWLCLAMPALYCTAIMCGMALMTASLLLFFRAVFCAKSSREELACALGAAVLGALAIAARPPIALANLLAVPLLAEHVRTHERNRQLTRRIALVLLPYVLVIAALLWYNHARFGDAFEFGVSYQMTSIDQSAIRAGGNISLERLVAGVREMYFFGRSFSERFPWIHWDGSFVNFPILFCVFRAFRPEVRAELKRQHLLGVIAAAGIVLLLIAASEMFFSAFITPRYRMDANWLLAIQALIVAGATQNATDERSAKAYGVWLSLFAVGVLLACVLLFCYPYDSTLTELNPSWLEQIPEAIDFGLL